MMTAFPGVIDALHHIEQRFDRHVFLDEVIIRMQFLPTFAGFFIGKVREHDDRKWTRIGREFFQNLETVHHGHVDVEDQHFGIPFSDFIHGLLAIFYCADIVTGNRKLLDIEVSENWIVFRNEDGWFAHNVNYSNFLAHF